MEKITIGLIPSPDLSENLINKITDKLKVNFEKKIDSNIDWQFEVKVKVFVGAFILKLRIIKSLIYIGKILYKNHQKKVEEITQDMKWNFLFSNVKRVTPEEATNTNIRFVLQNRIIGWLRVLTGMVFANRPWQAIGSFKKVLTLSFATGTYISIFSTPWQLSVAYTPSRFILLMLLSMTGMVVWINIAHNLWEKKSSKSQSQYRILYNVTT